MPPPFRLICDRACSLHCPARSSKSGAITLLFDLEPPHPRMSPAIGINRYTLHVGQQGAPSNDQIREQNDLASINACAVLCSSEVNVRCVFFQYRPASGRCHLFKTVSVLVVSALCCERVHSPFQSRPCSHCRCTHSRSPSHTKLRTTAIVVARQM
jgi:hypothetical protein